MICSDEKPPIVDRAGLFKHSIIFNRFSIISTLFVQEKENNNNDLRRVLFCLGQRRRSFSETNRIYCTECTYPFDGDGDDDDDVWTKSSWRVESHTVGEEDFRCSVALGSLHDGGSVLSE